jgi:hypothetical protein
MRRKQAALIVPLIVLCSCLAWGGPNFDRFVSEIAVDDGCKGRNGESIFRIEVNAEEVFKSKVFLPGDAPEPVDIDLAGAETFSLIIDDEGDGHGGDWGDWLDARLVDSTTGEFMFVTDLEPEEVEVWIRPNRDRNIIQNKIAINNTVYLRGWGGLSGSHNRFRNWNDAAAKHEADIDAQTLEAAGRVGELKLVGTAPLPEGLTLTLDGKPLADKDLKRGVVLEPLSVLVVSTDLTSPEHTSWWKGGGCDVAAADAALPLADLVQPTDRWVHRDIAPNHSVLVGDVAPEPQGIWAGKPFPPAGPITFSLRDLPLAFERARVKHDEGDSLLLIRARRHETTEIADPAAVTSARLTVLSDGREVATVFTDNDKTWTQAVALDGWPGRLECIASPGADGSMGDWFALDAGITQPGMKEPLWIRSTQYTFEQFAYGRPERLLVGAAWAIPGKGVVRWDGLADELGRRDAGAAALEEAGKKLALREYRQRIEKGIADMLELVPGRFQGQIDKLTDELIKNDPKLRDRVDAIVKEVTDKDPRQPDIRVAAAERLRELGNLFQERRQWGLLIEESRADLALIQKARERIDGIWQILDPAPFPYPDDGSPTRDARALGNTWRGDGEFLGRIWTVTLDKDKGWTTELTFPAPDVPQLAVMVNSRGVEVTARLAGPPPIGTTVSRTATHPLLRADLAGVEPGTPLTLTVSQNPDVTGYLLTHTMELVAWEVKSDADVPTEEWSIAINPNGSATVSRTSLAPVLAAVPRTATNLVVKGCSGYTVQEPITEYLVDWDDRLGGANLPLFVAPAPGETIRISYRWPEAAYNVPMSKYSWGRHEHTYMSTPPGILDTEALSVWHVEHVPDGWKSEEWTPAPANADETLFRVAPRGRLSARWLADEVLTAWISAEHEGMVITAPDSPNNRRWFPVWAQYVRKVYDKQLEITGHRRPYALYVGVQGASMLSGYGGGTAGDEHGSETWIPSSHRLAPCIWRHASNPCGVDSHEMHWITLIARPYQTPTWICEGFHVWLESAGWRATDLANCDELPRRYTANAKAALEMIKEKGVNELQMDKDVFRQTLPADTREKLIGLAWTMVEQIARAYGDDFWNRFWEEQRRLYYDVYPVLSVRAAEILIADELVRVSGDLELRKRLTDEWLLDLTPDPQDAPDRFLILPRQPKVFHGDQPEFAQRGFDDLAWPTVAEPRMWDQPGPGPWEQKVPELAGQRGVVWYRFTFDVPADFKTDNLELKLGKIDSVDETYVNGQKVGATGVFPPEEAEAQDGEEEQKPDEIERVYKVAAELLKPGQRNVVAVRVYDPDGGGGLEQRPVLISRIGEPE